jgi:UDP-glucose 4-epimerase
VERVFGYKASCGLQEGVAKMAAWAKTSGSRKSRYFSGIEIKKNMPAGWLAVAK